MTIASVILGREVELGSVFIVARSFIAVTPYLINYNIAVYRPNSRVGLLRGVYIGGVSTGQVARAFSFTTSIIAGIFLSL